MNHCREDDAELIERFRQGDQRSFERLHRAYGPVIRHACYCHGLRASEADDIEQDVWEAFCRYPPTLRRADGFASWLWVTATHLCQRRGRQRITVSLETAPDLPAPPSSAPDITALSAEDRRAVSSLLTTIRADERRLVELAFLEDRPNYRAISTALQRPVGSVGPTRARILRKLRAAAEASGLVA